MGLVQKQYVAAKRHEATAWQFQRQCKCSLRCRANASAWPAYGAAGSLSDTQHMGRHPVWASKRWLTGLPFPYAAGVAHQCPDSCSLLRQSVRPAFSHAAGVADQCLDACSPLRQPVRPASFPFAGVPDPAPPRHCDGVRQRGDHEGLPPEAAQPPPARGAWQVDLPAADHWAGLLPYTGETCRLSVWAGIEPPIRMYKLSAALPAMLSSYRQHAPMVQQLVFKLHYCHTHVRWQLCSCSSMKCTCKVYPPWQTRRYGFWPVAVACGMSTTFLQGSCMLPPT